MRLVFTVTALMVVVAANAQTEYFATILADNRDYPRTSRNNLGRPGEYTGLYQERPTSTTYGARFADGQVTLLRGYGDRQTGAGALNRSGIAVGFANNENGSSRAALWDRGGVFRDLGTLGGAFSSAADINERGWVAGTSELANRETHGFLWRDGRMTDLGDLSSRHPFTIAKGLNESGQIVGQEEMLDGPTIAWIWDEEHGLRRITSLSANTADINDRGDVIGQYVPTRGKLRAYRWRDGKLFQIGTDQPVAINNAGVIVGNAFDRGDGYGPIVWYSDRAERLIDRVLDLPSTHRLTRVLDIDEDGRILAEAQRRDFTSVDPVLLTPVPEPATVLALTLGLAALARKRRRKP
jgi:probable HAF family extracellular repeat protein